MLTTNTAENPIGISPRGDGYASEFGIASPHRNFIIGMIGDSFVDRLASTGGFMQYAIMASEGRLTQLVCDGVGGSTLTQMATRFDTTFSGRRVDKVWICGGQNDIVLTEATKIAVQTLAMKSLSIGAEPVFFLPSPRSGSGSVPQDLNTVSNYIRQFCFMHGFECNFIWDDMIDPATGGVLAGTTVDGQHATPDIIASSGVRYAVDRFPGAWKRPICHLDTWGSSGKNQLIRYPHNTQESATPGLSTGWNIGQYITPTRVPAILPEAGYWQKFAVNLPAAATTYSLLGIGGPEQDTEYLIQLKLKLSQLSNLRISVYIEWKNGASTVAPNTVFFDQFRSSCNGVVSFLAKSPNAAITDAYLYIAPFLINTGSPGSGNIEVISMSMEPTVQI